MSEEDQWSMRNAAMEAVDNGRYAEVKRILDTGFHPDTAVDDYDQTLLHCSAFNGHHKICKLLLDRGAAVNKADDNGGTALHCAASCGHLNICQLLIDRGATVDKATNYGDTPLHFAAEDNHTDVVTLLLQYGASPTRCNVWGETPLDKHCQWDEGNYDCISILKTAMAKKYSETRQVDSKPVTDIENNFKKLFSNKPSLATTAAASQIKADVKICWNCHAKESDDMKLLKCGGCKKARYCDQECQGQDWDRHQEPCQQLQERKRNKTSQITNRFATS